MQKYATQTTKSAQKPFRKGLTGRVWFLPIKIIPPPREILSIQIRRIFYLFQVVLQCSLTTPPSFVPQNPPFSPKTGTLLSLRDISPDRGIT